MRRTETDGQIVKIPLAEHLLEDASFIETATRNEAVARAKEILKSEWAEIAQWQLDNIAQVSGALVSIRLTSIVDMLVSALARRAWKKAEAPEGSWRISSVFALGGYGRGEMNPGSDLDIIVLHEPVHCPQWLSDANGEFNTLLWDSGFSVGSSMRSMRELEHIIKNDFVTATAVLEHRRIIGTADLEHELYGVLERFRAKRAKPFLQYKVDELMERRNALGASVFLLEPDIKTNPGCLRDVQFLLNAAFIVFGGRDLYALRELSSVSIDDVEAIEEANAHILQIRCLQHFHHATRKDTFELQDQVRVAKQLGYRGLSRLREVEVMMREHYHKILSVHTMVELLLSYLRNNGYLGRKITLIKTRRTLNTYFTSIAGQVYVRNRTIWNSDNLMQEVMNLFLIAHQKNIRISKELQAHIRAHLSDMNSEDRRDPGIARTFLKILGDFGHVQATFEDMHNCGFLGTYMPEFFNISCLMQFDGYHQYTVDQHTLFALGNLDRVHRGDDQGPPAMVSVLASVDRKDLLNLGLLLHDVGKYMGRGHVPRGAMMVGEIAKRMHLTDEEKDLVYFLVEKHVRMSDSSRMRDISDPEFVKDFAREMGSQRRLDMLYCLTYADAKAVGPKIMTGWQRSILGELYFNVTNELKGTSHVLRSSRRQRVHSVLSESSISEEECDWFLNEMPDHYIYQNESDDVLRHYAMLKQAMSGELAFEYRVSSDSSALLEVALPYHKESLSEVTAVCAGRGCFIADARCWRVESSYILFRFSMTHVITNKLADTSWWERIKENFQEVLDRTCNIDDLLEQRKHNMVFEDSAPDTGFADPAVKVEQKTSNRYSIFDVHHKDEPGSLSVIARAIYHKGYGVDYASVTAMGDIATGVFYVQSDGVKLNNDQAQELCTCIAKELRLLN